MKLELKFLAPYLPYGLKMQNEFGDIWALNSSILYQHKNGFLYIKTNSKPILRPMSDFWDPSKSWMQQVLDIDNSIEFWSGEFDNPCHLPYVCFELLIRNHFDVFDLLTQNLAISIHDLEK